jgi:hypothetical protein
MKVHWPMIQRAFDLVRTFSLTANQVGGCEFPKCPLQLMQISMHFGEITPLPVKQALAAFSKGLR